jgi:hypothetical protein
MGSSTTVRWVTSFSCYWLAAFGLLSFFLRGNFFCERDGGSVLVAVRLSLAVAVLDLILSLAIVLSLRAVRQTLWFGWLGPIVATAIIGALVAAFPIFMSPGGRGLPLELLWNTECAFTEGYGIAFPILIAPALALITFVKAAWLMRGEMKNTKGSDNGA